MVEVEIKVDSILLSLVSCVFCICVVMNFGLMFEGFIMVNSLVMDVEYIVNKYSLWSFCDVEFMVLSF